MTATRTHLTILLISTLVLMASSCGGSLSVTFSETVEGNGDVVTTTFDVGEFDTIDISDSFDATVTVGDVVYVDVATDEDLVEHLDIRVVDDELRVGLTSGISVRATELDVTIRLPQLRALDVSGASSVDVLGAFGPDQSFEVSGASNVNVEGTGSTVELDVSGASSLDLALTGVVTAEADVSGASTVVLAAAERLSGDVSGASTITVPAAATVEVDISGASSVERS